MKNRFLLILSLFFLTGCGRVESNQPRAAVDVGADLDGDGVADVIAISPEAKVVNNHVDELMAKRRRFDRDMAPEILELLKKEPFVQEAVVTEDHSNITIIFKDGTRDHLILKSFK